jgi:hypothetical protein
MNYFVIVLSPIKNYLFTILLNEVKLGFLLERKDEIQIKE